jgi:hypothetical protein
MSPLVSSRADQGRGLAAGLGLAVVLVAAAIGCQLGLEAAMPPAVSPRATVLYVRSGPLVRRLALSYDALLADVYWVRTIQHYGGTKRSTDPHKQYDLLYPLLDLTTTLDPRFSVAYRFGAIFLAEAFPNGPGRPDLAIALLEKGIKADPGKWQYLQDAGFVEYWWRRDFKAAAGWFRRASEVTGAPWWLKSLAAVTLVQGGDRAESRYLWQQILQHADHTWVRENAQLKLAQLTALDEIDQLQAAIASFVRARGRVPAAWDEMIRAGWLRDVPVDPANVPYVLQPGGTVTVSTNSRLYPLPAGPGTGPTPRS